MKPPKRQRTRFDNQAALQKATIEKLAESCLKPKDMAVLGIEVLTAEQSPKGRGGFRIWYYDVDGKRIAFWRFRNLEEARGFGATVKQRKYDQPAKMKPRVYFSPLIDWKPILANSEVPLLITEGELKAACATKHDLACLGLGGVWNFRSKTELFIAELSTLPVEDRQIYIVFDSDAAANPQVAAAENALAREFLQRGAHPFIVRLPSLSGQTKTALDDFIRIKGAATFQEEMLNAAKEWEGSEALFKFNEQFVHVRNPEMVVRFEGFLMMSPASFYKSQYSNRVHTTLNARGDKKEVSTALSWLKWPFRNQAERLVFEPGQATIVTDEHGRQLLNMWPGWGIEPKKGNVKPFLELLDHLFQGARREDRDWFLRWLAFPLQHPGVKMFSAVLMWGIVQGTGKTILAETMKRIYGDNFADVAESELFDSTFNEWAQRKQFIVCDEATGGGTENKNKIYAHLKSLITRSEIRVNVKHIRPFTIRDTINFYFTSNLPDCFSFEFSDRRLFVHEVTASRLPDDWGEKYVRWLDEQGGAAALFDYLLSLDLADFNPKAPAPMTEAKTEMLEASGGALQQWLLELKENPDALLHFDEQPIPHTLFTTEELFNIYERQLTKGNTQLLPPKAVPTLKKFALSLRQYRFMSVPCGKKAGNKRVPLPTGSGRSRKRTVWLRPGFREPLPKWATTHAGVAHQYEAERATERALERAVKKHLGNLQPAVQQAVEKIGRKALIEEAKAGAFGPHPQKIAQERHKNTNKKG